MKVTKNIDALNTRACNRVAVVGVGALGSALCGLMLRNCNWNAVLIDPDQVENHNLVLQQMLHSASNSQYRDEMHRPKAEAWIDVATQMCPSLTWTSVPREVADCDFRKIDACDLIFSCTDSALSRCETALIARLLGKPHVDGGVQGYAAESGRVSWFPAITNEACYACYLSEWRRSELFTYALSPSLGCMRPAEDIPMNASLPVIEFTAKQMLAVAACALDPGSEWTYANHSTAWTCEHHDTEQSDGRPWRQQEISLSRSATCPWHDDATPERLVEVETGKSLKKLLNEYSAQESTALVLELLWPVCLEATCRGCGATSQPRRRMAWVRRRAACPSCGCTGTLEPVAMLQTILPEAISSGLTLREIGFTDTQLLCLRPRYGRKEAGDKYA